MALRDTPFQALRAPLLWTAVAVAVLAAVVAAALVFTDHRTAVSAGPYSAARGEFDEAMEPVANVLSAPVRWVEGAGDYASGYLFAVNQNRALKARLQEMERWRVSAIALKNLNLRYEQLLKLRTDPPIPMVSAQVVSDARGPFSDARLANAGSDSGVKVGNPAMSEDGVVGRIVGVTRTVSRILLLTDVESRTPVLIDRTNARAILTGDGGPNPRLEFVRGVNSVQDGDTVLTSGDGGLYPRGLPVGVAAKDFTGVWRVRLYSDRAPIDFVRILVFDDFSRMVSQAQLAQSAMPALTPEEQAQLNAARAAAAKPAPGAAPSATGASAAGAAPAGTAAPAVQPGQSSAGVAPPAKPRVSPPAAHVKPKPKIPRGAYRPGDAPTSPQADAPAPQE